MGDIDKGGYKKRTSSRNPMLKRELEADELQFEPEGPSVKSGLLFSAGGALDQSFR